jgi:hypothetical protein
MTAKQKEMISKQKREVCAYLKVEVRSRSRTPWGWSLYYESNNMLLERSEELFRCAEDAWKAGQVALNQYMPQQRRAA